MVPLFGKSLGYMNIMYQHRYVNPHTMPLLYTYKILYNLEKGGGDNIQWCRDYHKHRNTFCKEKYLKFTKDFFFFNLKLNYPVTVRNICYMEWWAIIRIISYMEWWAPAMVRIIPCMEWLGKAIVRIIPYMEWQGPAMVKSFHTCYGGAQL